jgi:beta-lactamase superfamily II metal-dependent hydrolase
VLLAGAGASVVAAAQPAASSPTVERLAQAAGVTDPRFGRSRLVNASVRARAAEGEQCLIAGFVVSGAGEKPMLVRAIGPGLGGLGVNGFLTRSPLELHDLRRATIVARDLGWSEGPAATAVSTNARRVGAFPLAVGSADSALFLPLASGPYTANVVPGAGESGIALIEVYDADTDAGPQLINLSARTRVGAGDDMLTLGFVIGPGGPKQMLLRAVGPSLVAQGITNALRDPRLELRDRAGALLASNEDWGSTAGLSAVFSRVGAGALPAGSTDAALLATLSPGIYTVQVKSADGTPGVALAELYDVPVTSYHTRWTMLNVSPNQEQADCHLIELPDGRNVLIDIADAADAPGAAVRALQARGISHVDLVVLTHFHRDHYGRLKDLVNSGVTIDAVVFNLPAPNATSTDAEAPWGFSRAEANDLIQFLREKLIFCYTPRTGDRLIDLSLPDGTRVALDVICLYDGANTPVGLTDTNDTSIVLRLTHGATRVLFTGDLNAPLGGWLAASGIDVHADLLKVPHHGTEGCAPNSFFDRVGASAAFVPSPAGLWFSDRSARIRDYFAAHGTPAYVSGVHGDVSVDLGSTAYTITAERP